MLRQRRRTLQAVIALTDAVAATAAFFAAYYAVGPLLQRVADVKVVLPVRDYYWVLLVSVPMWWALFAIFRGYDLSPIERIRDGLLRLLLPMVAGVFAIGALTFFQKNPEFSRRIVASISLCSVGFILVGRALVLTAAARILRHSGGARRIIVVGTGEPAVEFAEAVRQAGWGLEIAGSVAPTTAPAAADPESLGTIADLPRLLDERPIDDVVVAGGTALNDLQEIIRSCEEVGVSIHIPSAFFEAALSRPHLERFSGIPMLTFSTRPYNPVVLGIKRTADIVLGALFLVVAALPMLFIAVLIKCSSRGPLIFKQIRGGLYGRPFTMYKFRSMVVDAEVRKDALAAWNEADGPAFKMKDDPRITRIGRVLRRFSLDELPQLWNVVRGDMSLVGPRPPLPKEVERYERWQRRRLSMRPGLTCIWQVSDRRHSSFEKWMDDDLRYIDNWSLWLDLKIAVLTIPAVLWGTGV